MKTYYSSWRQPARLYRVTMVVLFDKLMIYYALATLMFGGVR